MSDAKTAAWNKKWEEVRVIGRRNFVLLHGVLAWGFTTAIFCLFFGMVAGQSVTAEFVVLMLVCGEIGGWIFGNIVWNNNEKRYNRADSDS